MEVRRNPPVSAEVWPGRKAYKVFAGERMASIIIQTGERQGDFYPLGQRTTIVGRDEALTVQIKDPHISRKHLKIRFDPETKDYKADDMNSTNGVLINGHKIQVETTLTDDDLITIGLTTLLFTLRDFDNAKSALHHLKQIGERTRITIDRKSVV
jgi:pSer/pThr/pTyr-binding forkhead associated (FHA) protein